MQLKASPSLNIFTSRHVRTVIGQLPDGRAGMWRQWIRVHKYPRFFEFVEWRYRTTEELDVELLKVER